MDQKQKAELERAKALFYSWRLQEAYGILRRFFDRLPFDPQPEHALYLSIFVRCLLELGKDRELQFYFRHIEALQAKWKTPELTYQLAEVRCLGHEKDYSSARKLVESVISNPGCKYLHAKAKLFLAYCYDYENNDTASCRAIVDSIGNVTDPKLKLTVDIWKAKLLRDEGKFAESEAEFEKLLGIIDPSENWYSYFSVKVILAGLYLETNRENLAETIVAEMRRLIEGKSFKSTQVQISFLENKIRARHKGARIQWERGLNESRIRYQEKSISLNLRTAAAKLFGVLAKKKWLDKAAVIRLLYQREPTGEKDDKLVYYHIHTLRKVLATLGIAGDLIKSENEGYRLLPEVNILEGEI